MGQILKSKFIIHGSDICNSNFIAYSCNERSITLFHFISSIYMSRRGFTVQATGFFSIYARLSIAKHCWANLSSYIKFCDDIIKVMLSIYRVFLSMDLLPPFNDLMWLSWWLSMIVFVTAVENFHWMPMTMATTMKRHVLTKLYRVNQPTIQGTQFYLYDNNWREVQYVHNFGR